MYTVEVSKGVARRLRKHLPHRVQGAVDAAFGQLAVNPFLVRPDQPGKWNKVWKAYPNHRHLDLPDGWRLCYSVILDQNRNQFVYVLFIGTHREYEHLYGHRST